MKEKMVVLDDDPTGVQTVHDLYVYTDWSYESMRAGLLEDGHIFFVLTNSRGLSAEDSRKQHTEIMENLVRASADTGVPFTVLSRGDSTLRGHYPMETQVLKDGYEASGLGIIDGEVIAPFFPEGGRYTIGDVHYVQEGDTLVPAGMTEFAKDTTFGYSSSDLKDWVREKNPQMDPDAEIHSVSIDMLRKEGPEAVCALLMNVKGFEKVIVNSACYEDMEVFVTGLYMAMAKGKHFMFRVAAGLVRVMANIEQKPLLKGAQLRTESELGGLVIVGSHVKKTTLQLERLLTLDTVRPLEFDVNRIGEEGFETYMARTIAEVKEILLSGKTAVVFTSRKVVRKTQENSEANLRFSLSVSEALVRIVRELDVMPGFIVAKGGITSSDVGVKGLSAKRALVLGQILPGIPVWKLGEESKYPGICYVIFPGNVGNEDALRFVVDAAQNRRED
ncbi:MAG: hydroxyacid dehydrogenase [Clostridia bacterium]|nr:hydroxyacid dehydrogenase [Clostridia bacterium]